MTQMWLELLHVSGSHSSSHRVFNRGEGETVDPLTSKFNLVFFKNGEKD